MEKILFLQFANSMFLRHEDCDQYWDDFYAKYNDFGYWRGKYVFEIPQWIAFIDYMLDKSKYTTEVFYCEHTIEEAITKIKDFCPKYAMFSLMDCNKHFIEEIVKSIPEQQFIIGGYNDDFLQYLEKEYHNVKYSHTIEENATILGIDFKYGTDYSLFKGETVLPRLTLSHGCKNNCKFCIIPHGSVDPVDENVINQQIDSFKDLKFKLIYLDDKTFGQCANYTILNMLTERIKQYNKDFEGYVVQTTSGMLLNKIEEFEKLGVCVVEIGMETYNDEILRAYRKPSSVYLVDKCIEKCKHSSVNLILNVVVGFPEETEDTYLRTSSLIRKAMSEDGVIGINPAIYTDYTNEDNQGEIDFQYSDKIELHRKYWKIINNIGSTILRGQLPTN